MDLLSNLALGFSVAITPINLAYALVGCLLGTLVGVLPGIGAFATIAMLLPATYGLPPVSALIMRISIGTRVRFIVSFTVAFIIITHYIIVGANILNYILYLRYIHISDFFD